LIRNTSISPLRIAVTVACFVGIVAFATRATWQPPRNALVLSPLNVRSGRGTEYPVVGHAEPGTRIEISRSDTRGWAAMRRGSTTVGYVRALPRYVRTDEAPEPRSTGGGAAWWVMGGLAAAAAAWLLARGRSRRLPVPLHPAPTDEDSPHGHATPTAAYPEPATASLPETEEDAAKRNGREFEEWAARRVRASSFRLKDWRSDKYVEGVYAESTLDPDLVIECGDGPTRIRFAVECKWRRRFLGDTLIWGKPEHLRRYQRYADEHGILVYLLLGVGGSGKNPDEIYLVPLEAVQYSRLFSRELQKYDRVSGAGDVVFDVQDGRLRLLSAAG